MRRSLVPVATLCLGLAACSRAGEIKVSQEIYSALGDPAEVRQVVVGQAQRCWPGGDERLDGLKAKAAEIDGEPGLILVQASVKPGAPVPASPFFAVRFETSGGGITDFKFPTVPEDEVLARKLEDDVLLWANGTKACT